MDGYRDRWIQRQIDRIYIRRERQMEIKIEGFNNRSIYVETIGYIDKQKTNIK